MKDSRLRHLVTFPTQHSCLPGRIRILISLIFLSALVALSGCSDPSSEDGDGESNNGGCTPSCTDRECGDDGCGGTCGECSDGTACVDGACSLCGNGVLDDSETCDPTADVSCPSESLCVQDDACFVPTYSGSEETCDAKCETTEITECVDDDDCCPGACHVGNDLDCVSDDCGNGAIDPGENCDPPDIPCVSECEPEHACQLATLEGYPEACNVVCTRTEITSCGMVSDGCCPESCTFENDVDCPEPVCGDGVVEGDERCDKGISDGMEGACPSDCDDNIACTVDVSSGDVADCSAVCHRTPVTGCVTGDDCCPAGCTPADDADCNDVVCGDGVVDGDEGCDNAIPDGESGSCPSSVADCDDGDPCTTDEFMGMASDCSARCINTPIACSDGDGCCPYDCSPNEDAECAALDLCEDYCTDAMAYCVNANELYAARSECEEACADMPVGQDDVSSGDSINCRIHHLHEAEIDPDTHCDHAAENPTEACVDPN